MIVEVKRSKFISAIIPAVIIAGCVGCKQSGKQSDGIITVDVTASYPEKELILQDFMDVEYVPLETTDEFITHGIVEAVGKDILLARNRNDGNIFVFDRTTGKGIRKINRLGQSGEEYSSINKIVLDEDNNEMFVQDFLVRKIAVYDLYGNFKRSFKFTDASYYYYLFNYDRDHLICYKGYSPTVENEQSCHILISKQDGSIVREIPIPFKEIRTPVFIKEDLVVTPAFYLTFPCHGNWVFVKTSSDTVYTYSPDDNLTPFIVRAPSIRSMNTEVFLFPVVLSDRYYFMQAMKKEFDLVRMKGAPPVNLAYDKQENALFNYTVYNDDFSDKRQVSLNSEPVNHEIAIYRPLEASDLVEAYGKGQLKGKLKEIAAELDEESNPVIMLVKYKK
ncbi:MAG: 6-bladed beta-propeller [Tannerellaceae bacterium]|jgi:hypothetical protein|nr:6-bladed beta-propeller [Tannerellaceae bacterium]